MRSVLDRDLTEAQVNLVGDVMTPDPLTIDAEAPLTEAARRMADGDVGDLIVTRTGELVGIITDRDIVVRSLAAGRPAEETTVGEICSRQLVVARPDEPVAEAADRMRERALRRLIVVGEDDRIAGVLSLGDIAELGLAQETLAGISDAPPNV